jgi:hypothetical protein
VGTSAPALAFVGSVGLAAVQQSPPNASPPSPPADVVFVNGAWAVPGAPANSSLNHSLSLLREPRFVRQGFNVRFVFQSCGKFTQYGSHC